MRELGPISEADLADLDPAHYQQLIADVSTLRTAAAHLMRYGWFWLLWFGVMLVVSATLAGQRQFVGEALYLLYIFCAVLSGLALLFFTLAGRVARGRRWAIFAAMAVVAIFTAATIYHLTLWNRMGGDFMLTIVETLVLLGHLNVLKLLVLGLGASTRIESLCAPREC